MRQTKRVVDLNKNKEHNDNTKINKNTSLNLKSDDMQNEINIICIQKQILLSFTTEQIETAPSLQSSSITMRFKIPNPVQSQHVLIDPSSTMSSILNDQSLTSQYA